jgi:hypothetical protein
LQLEGNGAGSLTRLGHVRLVALLGGLTFVDAMSVGVFCAVLAEHVSVERRAPRRARGRYPVERGSGGSHGC